MSEPTKTDAEPCSECCGATVQFCGRGLNLEYRICSRYKEPGHITESEIREKIAAARTEARPSGRYA